MRTVHNPDWADGFGASLACGVCALAADPNSAERAGLLVLLCDQPLIRPETLLALREAHARHRRCLVFTDHGGGRIGPPALFARSHWPKFAALTDAEGAGASPGLIQTRLLPSRLQKLARVSDTPEDYARLCSDSFENHLGSLNRPPA